MEGRGWGSQGGCEQRIEVFVKIKKKKLAGSGWGGVRVDVNEELKLLSKFKKNVWGGGGRGRGRVWGVRVDVIEELKKNLGKFTKKKFQGVGSVWGGGGVRVDVNEELKFLCKFKKKKKNFLGGSGGEVGGGEGSGWAGQGGCERKTEVFVKIQFFFFFFFFFFWGGGGWGGVRVDVNQELKFFGKFKKKIGGGGGWVHGGVRFGGSGWM